MLRKIHECVFETMGNVNWLCLSREDVGLFSGVTDRKNGCQYVFSLESKRILDWGYDVVRENS